jgi:hypothetical protein
MILRFKKQKLLDPEKKSILLMIKIGIGCPFYPKTQHIKA